MNSTFSVWPGIFGNESLPDLVLGSAIVLSLFWLSIVSYRLRQAGRSLAIQQQRLERMESQMGEPARRAEAEPKENPAPNSVNRYQVLYLGSLGHSTKEIAKRAGIRAAEVDFIIKVDEHVRSADHSLVPGETG